MIVMSNGCIVSLEAAVSSSLESHAMAANWLDAASRGKLQEALWVPLLWSLRLADGTVHPWTACGVAWSTTGSRPLAGGPVPRVFKINWGGVLLRQHHY